MNKVSDPLTPGRPFCPGKGLFGLRVLHSDPAPSQVLAEEVWVAPGWASVGWTPESERAPVLSLGDGVLLLDTVAPPGRLLREEGDT